MTANTKEKIMRDKIILLVLEIKKIKRFPNATVFYTQNSFWVCPANHPLPKKDDEFFEITLRKDKCDA